ncbi:energy transducer TonB [Tenacibaculum jejuense]|uniref:TonB family protein n=1 Tax=Tenacibaculum jejuense TaxID=584609 RepID=A0A238U8E3_9FLAO|nr:energy transducer TonB [Tenacibaculum jejuense]SNR15256.1 TonB family protein precursor [Tenacibaculum jejuense]
MKHIYPPLLIVVSLFFYTTISSQSNETCDTPNNVHIADLNSISKCTIKQESDNKRKITLNVASNKIRKRVVRKRGKANSLGDIGHLKKDVKTNTDKLEIRSNLVTKKVIAQEILFSIVDEVPSFPECEDHIKSKSDCFNNQFSKHFAKNFEPERASNDGITGRVFLQFTVDVKGNVRNLLIKSRNKNKQLEEEIERVVSKLPKFTPGKHNGLPVNVKYSLPINFSE